MKLINSTFSNLQQRQKTALISFITAGDTHPQLTVPIMHALVSGGVDILELGVPFSDPMADGPQIQLASERALKHDVSLEHVFAMVKEFRQTNQHTPVVLMGYANPVETIGYAKFASMAEEAGVNGVLSVDLPPEEAAPMLEVLQSKNIAPIFLLAPTSSQQRIQAVAELAMGFIYYVSLRGVTGASNIDAREVAQKLKQIRAHSKLPLAVGFGIKDPATAAQIASVADAVVIGSAIVNLIAEHNLAPGDCHRQLCRAISDFCHTLRQALDAGEAYV